MNTPGSLLECDCFGDSFGGNRVADQIESLFAVMAKVKLIAIDQARDFQRQPPQVVTVVFQGDGKNRTSPSERVACAIQHRPLRSLDVKLDECRSDLTEGGIQTRRHDFRTLRR